MIPIKIEIPLKEKHITKMSSPCPEWLDYEFDPSGGWFIGGTFWSNPFEYENCEMTEREFQSWLLNDSEYCYMNADERFDEDKFIEELMSEPCNKTFAEVRECLETSWAAQAELEDIQY